MNASLRRFWHERGPRQRLLIGLLAMLLGGLLYFSLVQVGGRAQSRLHANLATLRVQAADLERHGAEIARLRAMPPPSASQAELFAIVQAQLDAAGLSGAIEKIDAAGPDQVTLVFGPVIFGEWLSWVDSLKAQNVRLSACRITALSRPGTVSVTASMVRGRQQ
jgi:type II secretory pathway component PulM